MRRARAACRARGAPLFAVVALASISTSVSVLRLRHSTFLRLLRHLRLSVRVDDVGISGGVVGVVVANVSASEQPARGGARARDVLIVVVVVVLVVKVKLHTNTNMQRAKQVFDTSLFYDYDVWACAVCCDARLQTRERRRDR